jgi:putative acetyltransferase
MREKNSSQNLDAVLRVYPPAKDPRKVGTYSPQCKSGGGTVYKDVLEYRVWVHSGARDDVCHSFANYESASEFADGTKGAEEPLVLVLQNPWICWHDKQHDFKLVHENRIAEWRVEWLFEDVATAAPEAALARLRREHPNGEP